MRFVRRAHGHTLVESVVARAQEFPSRDYRRWQIIAELATADFKAAFEGASALIRTGDAAAMVLGAEMCDQLFVGLREGRRFAHQAAQLLRPLCRPAQDPEVLSAALPPYVQLAPDAQPLLFELFEHPNGHVRRTAAQVVVAAGAEFAEDRQVDSLIALLDEDPDQGVREQAAESLELILTCYPYVSQSLRIVEALARCQDDPVPGIRAAALTAGIGAAEIDETLKRLTVELTAAEPAWQFVDGVHRLPPLDDGRTAEMRAQLHAALLRLRVDGWPQQTEPSRFPGAAERTDMLARALDATAPNRPGVPMDRRRAPRPRRRNIPDESASGW